MAKEENVVVLQEGTPKDDMVPLEELTPEQTEQEPSEELKKPKKNQKKINHNLCCCAYLGTYPVNYYIFALFS